MRLKKFLEEIHKWSQKPLKNAFKNFITEFQFVWLKMQIETQILIENIFLNCTWVFYFQSNEKCVKKYFKKI